MFKDVAYSCCFMRIKVLTNSWFSIAVFMVHPFHFNYSTEGLFVTSSRRAWRCARATRG